MCNFLLMYCKLCLLSRIEKVEIKYDYSQIEMHIFEKQNALSYEKFSLFLILFISIHVL